NVQPRERNPALGSIECRNAYLAAFRDMPLASFCRKTHRLLICNDLTVLPGRRTYLMPMLFHSYGCVESNGRHPQLTPAIHPWLVFQREGVTTDPSKPELQI